MEAAVGFIWKAIHFHNFVPLAIHRLQAWDLCFAWYARLDQPHVPDLGAL